MAFYKIIRKFSDSEIQKINKKFLKANPYSHVVIKNFLKESLAKSLASEIKKEQLFEKENDLFNFQQSNDLFFSKNKSLKKFNSDFLDWNCFNFFEKICSLKFNGTLDMSITKYQKGDYLLCHDDKLEGRRIAYILYLSNNFTSKDGGEFCLYSSLRKTPSKISKKYSPKFNQLLIFEVSPRSFHEVSEVLSKKVRYAIGGWLH